uniref:Uncharacterized protein n=1 Tax=Fundulus heteroclitus TaxID=8078 RepID=A0A3Q2PUR3_FUNHE
GVAECEYRRAKGESGRAPSQKASLFADDVIEYLQNQNITPPKVVLPLTEFVKLSGYSLNITKTQVLTINYSPSILFTFT